MLLRRSRLSSSIAVALGTAVLALFGQQSRAQAPQPELIIVTPVPGQTVDKDTIAANVQSASSTDLERSHADDLAAFMRRELGSVHVNDTQNNPFQPDINFRGFTASPLLGTAQGLSVYMDGVRLNQPFGDVVSWDLIPRNAIANMALMPGSNPLFGLNTLGGALNVQTKDGVTAPGTSVEATVGEYGRRAAEFEHGGSNADGWRWYVTGNRYHEDGWRDFSPSEVKQLFAKVGKGDEHGNVDLSMAWAHNSLYGNGLQEMRLLAANPDSVYTLPDITHNRGLLVNLTANRELAAGLRLSGNAYYRQIDTDTFNGDLNDDSLDQSAYQPNANERTALTAAGYSGFPTSGETAANTPFPKWRCIGQALLNDEPGEKCNGILNTTSSAQREHGFNLQLSSQGQYDGMANLLVVGAAYDTSSVDFHQGATLGYLNPDRSITSIGAVADGVHAGNVDGVPFDARVALAADTDTWSVFVTDTLALNEGTHLTLSGRYNRAEVDNRDAIHPAGTAGSLTGAYTFSRFNPALGLTHRFNDAITGYAGVNQGNRAPSAIELGCADPASPCKLPNAMAGDPPLKQVIATTVEAGLRGTGTVRWNAGVFRTDSRDDILFVADNAAGFGYFRNFGKTRREGFEAGLSTKLANVTVGANYSYINAVYRTAEVLDGSGNSSNDQAKAGFPGVEGTIAIAPGDRLPLIPRQILKLFAEAPLGAGFTLNADVTVVGSSYARGNENNAHVPDGIYYLGPGSSAGYTVMNLGVDWQALQRLTVFAQINNVFDRDYNTAAQLAATGFTAAGNFIARPFPANANGDRPLVGSTFFAPGAPRTAWLGVRYRFGG
ncbi:MAG TPA: TonB-dependent receptor [Candidatus Acidoferrum sp.]|nr:TonB-dependent receptor [Candidatus Acidoferrum sp.]